MKNWIRHFIRGAGSVLRIMPEPLPQKDLTMESIGKQIDDLRCELSKYFEEENQKDFAGHAPFCAPNKTARQ